MWCAKENLCWINGRVSRDEGSALSPGGAGYSLLLALREEEEEKGERKGGRGGPVPHSASSILQQCTRPDNMHAAPRFDSLSASLSPRIVRMEWDRKMAWC